MFLSYSLNSVLEWQASEGDAGFDNIQDRERAECWRYDKVPDWIRTHCIKLCLTEWCKKHPNDTCTECWAQSMLMRGLSGVCLNVFTLCEEFLQEVLWSGTQHV